MLCPLLFPSLLIASDEPSVSSSYSNIDLLLERAISENLIAGGVVVIGNHEGIISTSARGQLNPAPESPLLDERTVFDVASLTKVIATTPAVMKLLDEGRIALSDPLSRWFPEFADEGHGEITILNLLTHTSGLNDVMVSSEQSMQSTVRKAAAQRHRQGPGSRFNYADINFILLGELVHRVTGETLDAFCQEQIYGPLGNQDTMFLPPRDLAGLIAPTSGTRGGVVQDSNARRLGGVAGHAGLFSTAYDLSRYARLMLGRGVIDDRRILSEQVVAQMTTPYLCNDGKVRRGLGWDIESPFSAPKGNFFSADSFGHTGYSGSSIWIDPQQDMFVILLTRRVNYRDTRHFNQLRRDVSTIAAVGLQTPGYDLGLAAPRQVAKISEPALRPAPRRRVAALVAQDSPRRSKAGVRTGQKCDTRQIAKGRAARAQKLAKAGGAHRASRIARVAKSEAGKKAYSSKKRRHLPKG